MQNLTRFDPFREFSLDPFRRFDEMFENFPMRQMQSQEVMPRMKIDVNEDDKSYQIHADIPGAKKEDIKVSVEGNQVSISAQVNSEKDEKKEGMVRSERYCGQQYRSFSLAQEIDDANAKASYRDGVLELTLPKKPGGGGAKQVTIN